MYAPLVVRVMGVRPSDYDMPIDIAFASDFDIRVWRHLV